MRDTKLSQLPSIETADLQQVTGGRLFGGLLANLLKGGLGKGLLGGLGGNAGNCGGDGVAAAPQAQGGGGG
jgi:hypothetical protein